MTVFVHVQNTRVFDYVHVPTLYKGHFVCDTIPIYICAYQEYKYLSMCVCVVCVNAYFTRIGREHCTFDIVHVQECCLFICAGVL